MSGARRAIALAPGARAWGPTAAVALAVGFGLVVLRPELSSVAHLNDTPLHASMVRWAEDRLASGTTPFDGWYPYLGLGFPQFHHYQTLPHLLTAPLATAVGGDRAVAWTLYVLLASWPLSVYAGVRLLGWERWPGAGAALLAPLLVSASGYGFEQSSYTWQGYGAWSQLWGMWLLPLAWGLSWRAVASGRNRALAALVLAVTVAAHVLTGYLALVTLAAWVLAGGSGVLRRLVRAVVVGAGALAGAAWILVPVFDDGPWANYVGYERGTFWYDSFGARRVLGWLLSGSLFDEGRLPVVTVLVGIGAIVCGTRWRRDVRARAVLLAWVLSLLLFFGRPTLGPLLELLPGNDELFLHRFVIGVHLGGVVLGGIGLATVGGIVVRWLGRVGQLARRPALVVATGLAVALVALSPAWRERAAYADKGQRFIEAQERADVSDGADLAVLVDEVRRRYDGRVYAGLPFSWGRGYRVGYVPVYAELLNRDVDALGFTLRLPSLSTAVEVKFDESNPQHYTIFNVRYLLLPSDRRPPVEATLLRASGRHRLWAVEAAAGYVQVVDPTAPLRADRTTLATAVTPWLAGVDAARRRPTVALQGSSVTEATPVTSSGPGTVEPVSAAPERGTFVSRVQLTRPGVVVLAASFHPRWKVTVDGQPVDAQLVAPSFVGATVGAGTHSIVFRYEPYPWSGPLVLFGAVVLGAIAAGPRVAVRVRRRRGRGTAGAAPGVADTRPLAGVGTSER